MTPRTDTGPFSLVPEWVLDAKISDRAVRLYAVLRRHADKDDETCWPSRRTLAERLDCSPDSVDRAMADLVRIGAVERAARHRDDGSQASNLYRVIAALPRPTLREDAEGPLSGAAAPMNESHSERENPSDAVASAQPSLMADLLRAESPPKPKRARNPIYDALAEVFPAATASEGGRIGRAAAELSKIDPVPEPAEVKRRAEWVRNQFDNATVMAVPAHWSRAGAALAKKPVKPDWAVLSEKEFGE